MKHVIRSRVEPIFSAIFRQIPMFFVFLMIPPVFTNIVLKHKVNKYFKSKLLVEAVFSFEIKSLII